MSFTIAIKFSRAWCLDPFFDAFDKLKFDRSNCKLLIINNTKDYNLSSDLMKKLRLSNKNFKAIFAIQTNNPNFERGDPENFKDVPHPFTTWTSYYSFQIVKLIRDMVQDDIHIQLEDDSLPHPDAITHLLKIMEENKDCACATTPLTNRDVFLKTSCMGSYSKIEKKGEFIIRRLSADPKPTGIHEVEATSYATVAYRKEPFIRGVSFVENLPCKIQKSGSDIYLSTYLFRHGYKILLDYDCWGIHMDKTRTYEKKDCYTWDIIWDDSKKRNIVKIV